MCCNIILISFIFWVITMIKIAIAGYGNLGKGVECAVSKCSDMELVALFTRRNPDDVKPVSGVPVYSMEKAKEMKDNIDVMILCGGSAKDLPEQTPAMAKYFNVVDSFDTHAKIPEHFANVDAVCKENGTVGIISIGWDPGLFSLNRMLGQAILPDGNDYTFWGKGVSQGHSDAIRRIAGVKDARQYTIPVEEALEKVRNGENPELTTRQKHTRECFVVAEEGADLKAIEEQIVTMPNYFADYDTTVHFISEEELNRDHKVWFSEPVQQALTTETSMSLNISSPLIPTLNSHQAYLLLMQEQLTDSQVKVQRAVRQFLMLPLHIFILQLQMS